MASRSWVDIDLDAVAANAATLMACAPAAKLCAVVKANGYGHGAQPVARAALDAGAALLAVAQVDEGVALRDAGIDAPIWVLSEPDPTEFPTAAANALEPAVYSPRGIEAAASAGAPLTVHLKADTGMRRVGARPADVVTFAQKIDALPDLTLGSVWTHLASADADGEADPARTDYEENRTNTTEQLDRYDAILESLDNAGVDVPLRHAANSAGTIAHPRSHRDVVRCGIALYGLPPSPGLVGRAALRPALTWRSRVSFVKELHAGDAVSYGHRRVLSRTSRIATVPVGYADGYRRGLWNRGAAMLIGGRRRPIVGVVTMDQTVVDCGTDDVDPGDEVVLIGRQGNEEVTADELAASLGTINYEIPCGIGSRVERRYPSPG
jgi:alanine racemase